MAIRVLHDWSDADCLRILRNIRAAMAPDARLLVVDQLLESDPSRGQPTRYLVDMQMMAMFGEARERTEEEMRGLLGASGFALRRVLPTGSPVAIVEAVPA